MASPKFDRGKWELLRERFRLSADARPPAPDRSTPLADMVPGVMKSFGLDDRFWEQALINEWTALVGAGVAKHSRPGRVHRQTLIVFVKNSAWLSELVRYGQKQILENVQKRFGAAKIKSVRIELDPDASGPTSPSAPRCRGG